MMKAVRRLELVFACALLGGCQCGGASEGTLIDGGPDATLSGDGGAGGDDGGTGGDGGGADAADTGGDGGTTTPAIRISEVVLDPVHDWSDSDGAGVPWDGAPGTGAVNTRDQYVELYNAGSVPVDLSGWTLELIDDTPATTALAGHTDVALSAGSTLDQLMPGAYIVIGNPDGFASTDVFIVLRDSNGVAVNDVEIGGNVSSRDPEGDGVGDGAPAPLLNGFARGAFEEAVARPDGAADTDVNQADFVAMPATPLAPNIPPVPPPESVLPTVTGNPTTSSWQVSELVWIQLSEPVDEATVTTATVELTAGGAPLEIQQITFEADDSRIVLAPIGRLPYDTDIGVTVHGGSTGVADLVGNRLAADFSFTIHTESAPANPGPVLINEVVVSPVRDWSDDAGGDLEPFSATPGTGLVSSEDEWIELLSGIATPTDMTSYSIVVFVGANDLGASRNVTRLGAGGPVRVVGAATNLTTIQQGDRIVVGNPRGALFHDCWIELRDDAGVLLDAVEIGGNAVAEDRGGDGVNNGAPGAGADGHSTGVADEAIARVPDGTDTGDDIADFSSATATIGAAN